MLRTPLLLVCSAGRPGGRGGGGVAVSMFLLMQIIFECFHQQAIRIVCVRGLKRCRHMCQIIKMFLNTFAEVYYSVYSIK